METKQILEKLRYGVEAAELVDDTITVDMAELIIAAYKKGVGEYVLRYHDANKKAEELEKDFAKLAVEYVKKELRHE